jgi:hypothetical protein
MNKRELILLIIICIGMVLLSAKSLVLDEVKNLEGLDETFRIDIENAIDQTYNNSIIKYRLIKITTKENENKIIYTGKIRKYLLGVFPFSDIKIKIEYDMKEVKDES